jgi:6-phosphofructokinase
MMPAPRHDDSSDAMREWRWRSYAQHLEDLGYELDGGALSAHDAWEAGLIGAETVGVTVESVREPVLVADPTSAPRPRPARPRS